MILDQIVPRPDLPGDCENEIVPQIVRGLILTSQVCHDSGAQSEMFAGAKCGPRKLSFEIVPSSGNRPIVLEAGRFNRSTQRAQRIWFTGACFHTEQEE